MKKCLTLYTLLSVFSFVAFGQTVNDNSELVNGKATKFLIGENSLFQEKSIKNSKSKILNRGNNNNAKNIIWVCDTVTSFDIQNNPVYRKVYTFDEIGNCTDELTLNLINNEWINFSRSIYSYNSNGLILRRLDESWTNSNWDTVYRVTNVYNINGQIQMGVGENYIDHSWSNYARRVNTYGSNGELESFVDEWWYIYLWENGYRSSFTYDLNGNVSTFINDEWENDCWCKSYRTTYNYDSENRIVTNLCEYSDFGSYNNYGRTTYFYNNADNTSINIHEIWQSNNWTNSFKETYNNSTEGDVLSYLYELWETSQWVPLNRDTYTYDNEGNSISGKREHWDIDSWKPYLWHYGAPYYCNHEINNFSVFNETFRYEANYKSYTNTDNIVEYALSTIIYPNPATDYVLVDSKDLSTNSSIMIYDTFGRMVINQPINGKVFVKDLSKGIYYYTINNNRKIATGKLIVQ